MSDKVISFIQPSRNNLKYLKWSYNSIRKNLGYRHEICWADDFSDDGTWEWMNEIVKKDKNVQIYRNNGPERLGHTILYDTLVDMATNDIVMIYHADMYALPGLDVEINKHIKPGVVVSGTRIEPPLHPPGPEKILVDFGIEPEEFDEPAAYLRTVVIQDEPTFVGTRPFDNDNNIRETPKVFRQGDPRLVTQFFKDDDAEDWARMDANRLKRWADV